MLLPVQWKDCVHVASMIDLSLWLGDISRCGFNLNFLVVWGLVILRESDNPIFLTSIDPRVDDDASQLSLFLSYVFLYVFW